MGSPDLDLCYLTATEAVRAFTAKRLSPVELLDAQIARIESVGNKLNAVTYSYFGRAREQAKAAEAKYAKGHDVRPLEGIPTAIKDWHPVKGEITTYGSRIHRDFRPNNTAPTVERLFDAGAIMHIRTTTPEFGHSPITHSPLWGITRNPWNLDYSPGGSSGGAGASLASGMTILADGTDGGGSIRIPASASGVFGYKPPFGRNPLDREHPGETLLHYGGLARCVSDLALMQNVTSGPHPADLHSLREKIFIPAEFDNIRGWKIALSMNLGYFEVDNEVQKNTRAMAEHFRDLGATVDEVDLPWSIETEEAWLTRWEGILYAGEGHLLPNRTNELDPFVVKLLENGKKRTLSEFYGIKKVIGRMYASLAPILDRYNVLIAPTLAAPSVKADRRNDDPLTINGKAVPSYNGWNMNYPFNLVSQCPVMTVPSGFSGETGVPTGLQIVGRTYDDLSVFQAASALESVTKPWANNRPNL